MRENIATVPAMASSVWIIDTITSGIVFISTSPFLSMPVETQSILLHSALFGSVLQSTDLALVFVVAVAGVVPAHAISAVEKVPGTFLATSSAVSGVILVVGVVSSILFIASSITVVLNSLSPITQSNVAVFQLGQVIVIFPPPASTTV